MKSLEKLQMAMNVIRYNNDGSFDSVLNLLDEFIIDNEPKQKKTSIKDFCSKDKNKLPLMGIFHDKDHKCAVATDGYILIASEDDYKEEFAGKIIDGYGKEIEAVFPRYRSALPSFLEGYKTYSVSSDVIREGLKRMKKYIKENKLKKPTLYATHKESRTSFCPEMLIKFADYSRGEIMILDRSRAAIKYEEGIKLLIAPRYFDGGSLLDFTIGDWDFHVSA